MNKSIAIIPARGGSKRIPRKNIKEFCGKPIIAYSIEAALQSNLFDIVMVSTDDEEIAEVAKSFGAQVPFFRSEDSANDYAPLAVVVEEVLQSFAEIGETFDSFCCILPTAPFINADFLISAYDKLSKTDCTAVFPVAQFSYPIQRALHFDENRIKMIHPENMQARSQDLEDTFHDAGQFYFLKTDAFLKEKVLFTKNASSVILPELMVQDIDTEVDWQIAELKYKLVNEQ
ncbi:pseudaminic acid cytidylyltransferase [Plebeiibacterium marinum]|uniref:Pseudaminic acid cytidylyltransferase n=1 Tax=Plebeiibacterium marinum TaxID=2992111 RepID=A0AAE3MH32_9BACT|nr:pseudaminic acid cytidylyltransferase [Plebeiobacterium marinum]MCW3807464.1 pseudaminic acid cytidylyltransferase [Plebeiobacterium marinum]